MISSYRKKLLILDLDETLIHASDHQLDYPYDFFFENFFLYKRPFLEEFLSFCRRHFHVAVWTSSSPEYASRVVENIFVKDYPLKFVWTREQCTLIANPYENSQPFIKNLKKVKRRGFLLEEILMVDDTPSKLSKNYGNLIRVNAFTGDRYDRELQLLIKYLKQLRSVENVRTLEKRGWQRRLLIN